ncbi:hypothetical protein COB21_03315 [Candidatus Aerophobetes bacterium]|uniref:UvrD-like helicase C-terminal domain-containing protein n=1 Tax=Aerophobetes bacterium TaxID=2030807 RepID=A0A2A4X3U5_UNCAE|nr:MAG: hypothetical protein COB21_03315 [Candidatus Aerophobetes bacterium]
MSIKQGSIEFEKTIADLVSQDGNEKALFQELLQAYLEGHLCIEKAEKIESPFIENIRLGQKRFETLIGRWDNLYYLQRSYVVETKIFDLLKSIMGAHVKPLDIQAFQPLNRGQKEAVKKALKSAFFCLTGGPGTGKTHTIVSIIYSYLYGSRGSVVILAPTGKAATVLKKRIFHDELNTFASCADRIEITTLHKYFALRPGVDPVWLKRGLGDSLCIVDEASMIDTDWWVALLSAVSPQTRLVVCGDPHQLPPVEIGSVFFEICKALKFLDRVCFKELTSCMRTDNKEILSLAEKIKKGNGHDPIAFETDLDWEEVMMTLPLPKILEGDHKNISTAVVKAFFKQFMHVRILSPLKKGPWGTNLINKKTFEFMRRRFQEGETLVVPIMVVKNDASLGLSNGDLGLVFKTDNSLEFAPDEVCFFIREGAAISIPLALLPAYEISYALSVHKSQGSEFEHVLLLLPPGSENFGREVAYTAVTRAKKSVRVISDEETVKAVLSNSGVRNSGLSLRFSKLDNF